MAEDKPLIQRQPGTAKDDSVFDIGHAYKTGESAGTFVSDKKRTGVLGQLKNAAKEVAGGATKAVKEVAVTFEKPEKPKVAPGTERKDIIERAVQQDEQAPKDDHDLVIERIRTFQKDAERVSGKPYLITKNKEQKKSSWSHVLGDKPEETKEETATVPEPTPAPAPKPVETIRRTPEPQMEQIVVPSKEVLQKEELAPVPAPAPKPEPQTPPVQEAPKPAPKPPVRQVPPTPVPQESSTLPRTILFTVLGVVVAAGLLGGGFYLYTTFTSGTSTTVTQEPLELDLNEYLPVEQLATLPVRIDGQEGTLSQVTVVGTLGSTDALSTAEFLETIAENVPNALVRSLDTSMAIGGVRGSAAVVPYLIFRTQSFDNAFAGMLAWERTIGTDLTELFSRAQGTAFVDRVVENHHVRILYDVNGIERLVYGFINGRTLVITATSAHFRTITSAF